MLGNGDSYFKTDNVTVLNRNIPLDNIIKFPIGHPKPNGVYVGHPYNPNQYVPIENYDYELLNDRINEYCYLLQCLGATEIEITNTQGETKSQSNSRSTTTSGGVSGKIGSVNVEYGRDRSNSSENETLLKIGRHQHLNPTEKPYIPEGLAWFPNEAGWQRLAEQRLNGKLLTHNESISSQKGQVLSTSDIENIKADIGVFLLSINFNRNVNVTSEIKNNATSEWNVRVVFKPLEEFDNAPQHTATHTYTEYTEVSPTELPQNTNGFTDNELKFLETLQTALEDDVITESEQRILERMAQRYNITSERIEELKAHIINEKQSSFTANEQHYLEALEKALEDNVITDSEQRILERIAQRYNISPERAIELKTYILIQKQGLSPEEKEYLEEVRFVSQDSAISADERALLFTLASQLGISEERAAEIEQMV